MVSTGCEQDRRVHSHDLAALTKSIDALQGELKDLRVDLANLKTKVDRGGGVLIGLLLSAGAVGTGVGTLLGNVFNK